MFPTRHATLFVFTGLFFITSSVIADVWHDYAIDIALEQEGDIYRLGMEGPDLFDCSGLTQYAYRHVGVELPRTALDQSAVGQIVLRRTYDSMGVVNEIDFSRLKPGDLLFFGNSKSLADAGTVGHVGLYVGGTSFINAYYDETVQEEDLTAPRYNSRNEPWYWKSLFISARRLPSPPGPSTKFVEGDIVKATEDGARIRDARADWNPVRVDGVPTNTVSGTKGRVQNLPMYFSGNWYWEVDFESGADGWVAEQFLEKVVVEAPTATLSASPLSIEEGGSSTLTWSSTNATWCEGTGFGFDTNDATSGAVSVSPAVTTEYGVTCTGDGGSATATVILEVAYGPPATDFAIGDAVELVALAGTSVVVWDAPNGSGVGTQEAGARGEVVGGPVYSTTLGAWMWEVKFEDGLIGWVAERFLREGSSVGSAFPLNDTGITACSNATTNGLPCPVEGFPGQDAEYGRDVTHNDDSDGHAGFSFTKISNSGNTLPASATLGSGPNDWACTQDNVTGRAWEIKTATGLRSRSNTYTWYNPDASTNGGSAGTQNGGVCTGSACDTHAFVQAVNAEGLCGKSDWRLPSRFELMSIVSNDRYHPDPAIDTAYFTSGGFYVWSSSPNAASSSSAWYVLFFYGTHFAGDKNRGFGVHLVRDGQ